MAIDINSLVVGDKITIKSGAYNIAPYNDGKPNGKFASFVYNMEFTVMQVGLGSDKGKKTNYVAFGISGKGYTGAIAVEDIKSITKKVQSATPVSKAKDTKPKDTTPKKDTDTQTNPYNNITTVDTMNVDDEGGFVIYNGHRYDKLSEKKYEAGDAGLREPNIAATKPRPIGDVNWALKHGSVDLSNISQKRESYDGKSTFTFPKYRIEYDKNKKPIRTTHNYTIDLSEFWKNGEGIDSDDNPLRKIEAVHQIPLLGRKASFTQRVENYFRFKLPNPNNALTKGFAHVFFTRPDLNVLDRNGSDYSLPTACRDDSSILYAYKSNINLLRELVSDNGMEHDFMFLLSNAAQSFSLLDEKIKTDEWSKTWTGHTVTYGKHSNDSKSASTFEIEYIDDRNLNIYHLHKLWIDYIDKVYRGSIIPRGLTKQEDGSWAPPHGESSKGNGAKFSFTADKVLDYACSVYYILTAEDGESIIFWSKYYGVFPTVAPSSPFSYTYGDMVKNPKLTIEYAYSFKQDYNPFNLAEFNWLYNKPRSDNSTYKYVSSYNPTVLGAGPSRVGAPFIETIVNNDLDEPYQFKLRFRPVSEVGEGSTYYKSTKGMMT